MKFHIHNWHYFRREFKKNSPLTKYGAVVLDRICVKCLKVEVDYNNNLQKYNRLYAEKVFLYGKLADNDPTYEYYMKDLEYDLIWKIFKEPYIT